MTVDITCMTYAACQTGAVLICEIGFLPRWTFRVAMFQQYRTTVLLSITWQMQSVTSNSKWLRASSRANERNGV